MCKYLLVGVYTFPVTRKGHPLIEADQQESQDQPLPDPGELTGEEELGDDQLQEDLLQEQEEAEFWGEGEDGGRVAERVNKWGVWMPGRSWWRILKMWQCEMSRW